MEMQYFSDDILKEILTFLPAKPLMRCKCVCKAWNILIPSPEFIRSYYARSRPTDIRLLFQLKTYPKSLKKYYSPKTSESRGFSLQLEYFSYDHDICICSNHCNGLVCLYEYTNSQVYLYNVTTREIKGLCNLSAKYPSGPKLFLGFDHVTGNYKLLYIGHNKGLKGCIITLGGTTNNSWRTINVVNHNNCTFSNICIFLNGVLYCTSKPSSVPYFNFSDEKFGHLLPPPQSEFRGLISLQTALWGKLAMYSRSLFNNEWVPLLYDDVNKVFTEVPAHNRKSIEVAFTLVGEERIYQEKKAHVLATTSLSSAPAFLLSSSSRPSHLKFVRSFIEQIKNNKPPTKYSRSRFVSSFVENIIPLASLLQ